MARQMTRVGDWPVVYADYIKEVTDKKFDWMDWNCCTFVTSGVKVLTGEDLYSVFDMYPKNKREALRDVKRFAGHGVLEMVRKYELIEVSPLQAGRGDVVYYVSEDGEALGLVDLSGRFGLFLHPVNGLGRIPLNDCLIAWRV